MCTYMELLFVTQIFYYLQKKNPRKTIKFKKQKNINRKRKENYKYNYTRKVLCRK